MIYKRINFEGKTFFYYCAYVIGLKPIFGTSYKKSVDSIIFSIQKSFETQKWTQFRIWINLCDRLWGSRRTFNQIKVHRVAYNFAFVYVWVNGFHILSRAIPSKLLWRDVLGIVNGFKPFNTTGLFLYPLKILENQTFSDIFKGCRKKPRHEMV